MDDIKIGNYTFEWGEVRGSMRAKDGGEPEAASYKVMRNVARLQKQPDGEWKVHRTIRNENPQAMNQI
jgi:ketosteroid isomerase-like protein